MTCEEVVAIVTKRGPCSVSDAEHAAIIAHVCKCEECLKVAMASDAGEPMEDEEIQRIRMRRFQNEEWQAIANPAIDEFRASGKHIEDYDTKEDF